MDSSGVVVLNWTFTPPDYFEERIEFKRNNYEMVIELGKVEVRIKPENYESNPNMRDDLQRAIDNRFLGVQLVTGKPYELSKATMYRQRPDGLKNYTLFAEPGVYKISGGTVDFITRDKNGNIMIDSSKDRIKKKITIGDLSEKYGSDPTVSSLLKSHRTAVNDPNNELVHLYEIRDAISKRFGGESAARCALNITSKQWSRLGVLANSKPLKQGRHRG
jgi:hypothetical protein